MVGKSTERFLELLEKQNAAIAVRKAKEAAGVGEDPIRLQREEERRDKFGQLRAREKPSRRQHRVRHIFGHPYGYTNHSD